MAITPEQAIGAKRENEQAAIEAFEKKCDDALRENWTGRRNVTVSTKGVSQFVCEEVIRRFRQAGWTVKDVADQRDGDYLDFSAPAAGQFKMPTSRFD